MSDLIHDLARQIDATQVIPYFGPGVLALSPGCMVPAAPEALATQMTAKVSVPYKIRARLTQAAQFIENFKHRKSLVQLMDGAFAVAPQPSALQLAVAASAAPLCVDTWYDDGLAAAFAQACAPGSWMQLQGMSHAEHFGQWFAAYGHDGALLGTEVAVLPSSQQRVLYKPLGGHAPAHNYLVSDSDHVEVLTEIDIQTPIPPLVQALRSGRHFLFIGCRFDDQLARSFARQIMKRSSDRHWAVLPHEPTRMEARFLAERGIERIAMPLEEFADALVGALQSAVAA